MADHLLTAEPPVTPPASGAPATPAPVPAPGAPAPPGPSDWRASLPDDLKADKSLEKFKGPAELARSYKQLESYQGRSVAIPGPDATPEEREAFWAKVGRPETPDKYVLPLPESLPIDETMAGDFKQTAHRLGLTQAQVAGLTAWFGGSPLGNPAIAGEKLHVATRTQLQAEWGGAYAHNLTVAQQGARQIFGSDFVKLMEDTGLGNHPVVIKAAYRIGKDYMDAGDIPKDAQTGGVMSPHDATQKIAAIYADKTHPFHRGDRAATEEMQRLFQLKAMATE